VTGAAGPQIRRAAGRIKNLETLLREKPIEGRIGLGHTRWATHGRPTDENAHPHTDGSGDLVVVHNGIIENYLPIKERLQAEGHAFKSETDTEVIAHLIERHLQDTPKLDEAVRRALRELRGSYAVVVLHRQMPDRLVAAKLGAGSVVVGLGETEIFLASDLPAILSHTRDVVVLEDEDVAVVTRRGVEITQLDGARCSGRPPYLGSILAEKGGYRHFMLEGDLRAAARAPTPCGGRVQPETAPWCCRRASTPKSGGNSENSLVACGTSYHSAIVGRFMLERLTGITAEVDLGSGTATGTRWSGRDPRDRALPVG
jgi:glucosamine--fructose-6-phosphate aminotransferase (isomerizing)